MKKIVYIISTLKKLGPTNVLAGIILNLDTKKFKPIVITLSPEENLFDSWLPKFKEKNIEFYSLNLSRFKGLFFTKNILCKIINKINPDIIHCHCFRSTLFSALFLKKLTKIVTIHCDFDIDFSLSYGKLKGKIMSILFSYVLKFFDKRIAVSKLLADILNKKYSNLYFDYVNNGIDTDLFKPENKIELRKKLNLPLGKKIFIWCGSFIERKDPVTLVNTIKQIKNENLFFIFCGNGKLLNACKKEIINCENVLFTGYVSNIKEYLQASDFYISTSISEGFHLTLYEAMACGLPVLLTTISVYDELKKRNVGLFFETQSVDNLKEQINNAIQLDYFLYSKKMFELIQKNFSAKIMSNKYQKYYD